MATELAKAYVQIVPSAKGMQGKITEELGGEATSAGASAGSSIASGIKKMIAAAGIGAALKAAVSEGADLQQSIGGIETLFKESADTVKKYADEAYRTTGLSANEYMENVTSFSASLLASLGGDTAAAAESANTAMIDMADNANKMGTDMEAIQNAYQGFAKQNYTMLDNLKLGYGGTKSEMERLLADAQKISGVEYNIDNLSDVYSAIHVIQGELDITGTTAKEASSTISGSFASMKSAFKNVIGKLALGEDIKDSLFELRQTVFTFITGNLVPMIGNILQGLPDMLSGAIGIIEGSLNLAKNNADEIVNQGIELVSNLVSGIIIELPYIAEAAIELIASFGSALMNADWEKISHDFILNLNNGLDDAAGSIFGSDNNIIDTLLNFIQTSLPDILNEGVEIVTNIANGIMQSLPSLITMAGQMITTLVSGLIPLLPSVLSAGAELILNLVNGIINNLPQIILAAANMIAGFLSTIGQQLPQILQSGIEIIGKLAAGLIMAIPGLIRKIPQIIQSIREIFSNTDWGKIGDNIIKGIAKGLMNAAGELWEAVREALGDFKKQVLSFFGIHSPSTWGIYVGEMIDTGIANGLTDSAKKVFNASNVLTDTIANQLGTMRGYELNTNLRSAIEYESVKRNTLASSAENDVITSLNQLIRENESRKQMTAYFYLDRRLIGKALAEPISDTIDSNKRFDYLLKGVRV